MKTKQCLECEEDLPVTDFGSNGKSSNGKHRVKPRCKKCNNKLDLEIFFKKLCKAVGGKEKLKCKLCGYDTYVGALEFHHIDPTTKNGTVSRMKNYSYAKIKAEVDKCVILCGCCHPEVHAGIRKI